eukprot:15349780-Ditylum_brightwellii.AAC.1
MSKLITRCNLDELPATKEVKAQVEKLPSQRNRQMAWNFVTTTKIPLPMMALNWMQTTPNSQEWTLQTTATELTVIKRTTMEITAMMKARAAVTETKMTLATIVVIAVGATTMTVS